MHEVTAPVGVPSRHVDEMATPNHIMTTTTMAATDSQTGGDATSPTTRTECPQADEREPATPPILQVHLEQPQQLAYRAMDNPDDDLGDIVNMASLRAKNLAGPERMQEILDNILIGPNLSDKERTDVIDLIKQYPDIF